MATRLSKPVTRETAAHWERRPIMASMTLDGIMLWKKGTRTRYTLPFEAAYWSAVKLAAEEILRQKRAEREARRKLRAR